MKGKNLAILIVLAAVLVGWAVLSSRRKEAAAPDVIGKPVLPGLALNDIEKVIVHSNAGTATVARAEDGWTVPGAFGYPADFGKVRELLLKLADMKIGQQVIADEVQRRTLGIVAPGAAATEGAGELIELQGAGGNVLASLLVGAQHQRKPPEGGGGYGPYPDGTYVSADGGKAIYLVSDLLDSYRPESRAWLSTEILTVAPADIQEVAISGPNRDELKLARKADGSGLELQGLSPDEESDSSKVLGIESALSYLRFDEVADPALSDEQTGLAAPVVFTAVTKKGQIYTVRLGGSPTNDTRRYARVEVALKPEEKHSAVEPASEPSPGAELAAAPAAATNPPAIGTNNTKSVDEDVAAAKAAAEERRKLEEEVADLSRRLKPWTFVIEAYKAELLTAVRSSVVKKKETATAEEPEKEDGVDAPRP